MGLAATLALLKGTGDLGKAETLAGRAKDRRGIDISIPSSDNAQAQGQRQGRGGGGAGEKEHEFDIKLDYRDEFGRKLTQKEAFRQLNYAFHGYGPGKKNQERRLKQLEEEKKLREGQSSLQTGSFKALQSAQNTTGMAHVTLGAVSGSAEQEKKAIERVVKRLKREEEGKK